MPLTTFCNKNVLFEHHRKFKQACFIMAAFVFRNIVLFTFSDIPPYIKMCCSITVSVLSIGHEQQPQPRQNATNSVRQDFERCFQKPITIQIAKFVVHQVRSLCMQLKHFVHKKTILRILDVVCCRAKITDVHQLAKLDSTPVLLFFIQKFIKFVHVWANA